MTEPENNIEVVPADTGISAESVVEALLFSSDAPVTAVKLAGWLAAGDAGDVKRHIAALNERYEQQGAAFRVELIAGGYQMLTLADYNPWISKLHKSRADSRLSKAALETLAIVAYKQPVLRADVESVRGVAVGDMLVRLREMNLVKIAGRAEEIGRPLLYGTTKKFLEAFGLHSLKDLPELDESGPGQVPALRVAQDSELDSGEVEVSAESDDAVDSANAGDFCDSVDGADESQDL